MTQGLTLSRRIPSGVFGGIGGLFLFLIPFPFILNEEDRANAIAHNWASRDFRALVMGLGTWFILGTVFLSMAFFVRRASPVGLVALILVNIVGLVAVFKDDKGVVLAIPLSLSLICLLIEEYKALVPRLRRTS